MASYKVVLTQDIIDENKLFQGMMESTDVKIGDEIKILEGSINETKTRILDHIIKTPGEIHNFSRIRSLTEYLETYKQLCDYLQNDVKLYLLYTSIFEYATGYTHRTTEILKALYDSSKYLTGDRLNGMLTIQLCKGPIYSRDIWELLASKFVNDIICEFCPYVDIIYKVGFESGRYNKYLTDNEYASIYHVGHREYPILRLGKHTDWSYYYAFGLTFDKEWYQYGVAHFKNPMIAEYVNMLKLTAKLTK